MPKILTWVLVAIVVIVGGYFIIKSDKVSDTEDSNPKEVKNETGKKMAFSQFIKNGGSYKCEVKQSISDMENSGTVYISSDKIKGDYTTISEGRTVKTSFIMRDGYSYTWGDMMAGNGFKIKIAQDVTADQSTETSGTYSWNAEQVGDYNCEPWTVNDAVFALPSGITFTDLDAMSGVNINR